MNIGPAEILVILFIALVVFGPQRLPEVGRQVGNAMRELRRMQDTVRGELDSVLHPDISPDLEEPDQPDPRPAAEHGDHTAIATRTGSAEIVGPDDVVGAPDPDAASNETDSGFEGPTDSFT
jgi:Tat protein translocase TatB subunit